MKIRTTFLMSSTFWNVLVNLKKYITEENILYLRIINQMLI